MEEIDIDRLSVAELVMLLDRSLDPDLPVPLLESAQQRLTELDPRIMPTRPGPPNAVSVPKPDVRSLD